MPTILNSADRVSSTGRAQSFLKLSRLPDPVYEEHPAYGKLFKPKFGESIAASVKLLPWLVLVAGKRILLLDRIPALPGYKGHLKGGLIGRALSLPRYIPYILKALYENIIGMFGANKPTIPSAQKPRADEFCESGFAFDRVTQAEKQKLLDLLETPVDELIARRSKAGNRTFEGNTRFFNSSENPDLFDTLNEYLGKYGMLSAASQYIGRPAKLVHLLLQINDPKDTFYYGTFKDIDLPDSKTNYMHVDTSYDMVKCVIYLNEVDDENGPFSYVLGSHIIKPVGFEGVVRRAVDRSGLSGFNAKARRQFYSLPKVLRRKCTFGADLLDSLPEQKDILRSEYYFTSKDGDIGLFANNGLHRGGLTKSRERRVLFGVIA